MTTEKFSQQLDARIAQFDLLHHLPGRGVQGSFTPVILYSSVNAAICLRQKYPTRKAMKAARAKRPLIRIAVLESDPLRVGFRALFDSKPDFELISASLPEIDTQPKIDLVLLGDRSSQKLFDVLASLKATHPHLQIVVTGSGMDEETILLAIASWAPRRVLSMFIERVSSSTERTFPAGHATFTDREQQVLEMLVGGRSNKEIGAPLGIGERTVKAHVAKLLRNVGVQNRIALSIHAVTHSLVSTQKKN